MVGIRLSGRPRPPTWLALGHGAIAVAGLGTLINAALATQLPTLALAALGGFGLAALGGATIFGLFHLQGKPLPIPLMLGHGAIAVVSFVLLLLSVIQS